MRRYDDEERSSGEELADSEHEYRSAQWGETAMVRTWSEALLLLLKIALSMLAKLKAKPAGKPRFGSAVVCGALASGTEVSEDASGLIITEPAGAGPSRGRRPRVARRILAFKCRLLRGRLAVARIRRWRLQPRRLDRGQA